MKERLDKSFFKKQSLKEADDNLRYWRSKSTSERLQSAYQLSLRAFGYDPDNPPKLEKNLFTKRTRPL